MLTKFFVIHLVFIYIRIYCVDSQDTTTNPAFQNIAPCGCDLIVGQYDNNCCCDPDFEESNREISNCISGPYGGNFTTTDDRLCRTDQSFTSDWFPFTCILFLNSPGLGLYYYPSTEPGTSLSTDGYSYVNAGDTTTVSCGQPQNYNSGDTINAFSSSICRNLTLPQVGLSGVCIMKSPVRYLIDTVASCDVVSTDQLCTTGDKLDAAFFTGFTVEGITPTVSYFCSDATNDPTFIKTNTGMTEPTTENIFAATLTNNVLSSCDYFPPVLTNNETTCQNAVAAVSYIFTWNVAVIIDFKIEITLVNADLTIINSTGSGLGPNNVLAQKFTTTFNSVNNSVNNSTQSGFPGYEIGLPVKSANNVTGAAEFNTTEQLMIWSPTSSGLCGDATLTAPLFGFDILTGCTLVFGFQDCTSLRTEVENNQRELMTADLVSRFGNPVSSNALADWITVVSNITDYDGGNVTAGSGQCQGVPSRAVLEFMWAVTGYGNNGEAIREIVGARKSWIRETWDIKCTAAETSCDLNTYVLYSSVVFTEVPAQTPTPSTSYELNRNDTCVRDATCWPELLLPIQPEFFYLFDEATASMLRSYNYGWAIVVTFFSIAVAIVPAHWSSVGRYLKEVLPL